ncbi:MAG: hypothetical protein QX197_15660 [Methylococcaceae bacterium]
MLYTEAFMYIFDYSASKEFIPFKANKPLMQTHLKQRHHPRYFLALLLALTTVLILVSPESKATPSFSRQTGMACSQCHTQAFGSNLTPFEGESLLLR